MTTMPSSQNRVPEGVPTGGQFAASARSEADVALNDGAVEFPIPAYDPSLPLDVSLEDADYENTPLGRALIGLAEAYNEHHAAPCCDAETTLRDWQETGFWPQADNSDTPLARALSEANLPGTFRMTGENMADYSDEHGHFYEIQHYEGSIQVKSQDTDAQGFVMPFDAKKSPMQPEEVVDVLEQCRTAAADIRGFNTAATKHFGTGRDAESPYAIDPVFDYDAGTVEVDGIVIGAFTRDDREMDGPTMQVWVDKGERPTQTAKASFTFFRSAKTGDVNVYRGEDFSEPLAHWEQEALDSLVAHRTRRSGAVPYTRQLFRDAIKAAEKQD